MATKDYLFKICPKQLQQGSCKTENAQGEKKCKKGIHVSAEELAKARPEYEIWQKELCNKSAARNNGGKK